MVINELHILRALGGPHEAYSPLIVHSDRVLPRSAASERLQPIAGRRSEIVQCRGCIQIAKLPSCDGKQVGRKTFASLPLKSGSRPVVFETPDHINSVS
jgi:hypothetical protein